MSINFSIKMRTLYLCFFFTLFSACKFNNLIIVERDQNGNILLKNYDNKTETDTFKITNDQILLENFKIINKHKFVCFGNEVIITNGKFQHSYVVHNSLAETFHSSILMNDEIILVDSMDFSYFNDSQIFKNEFTLLGFDDTLKNKLFAIQIKDSTFKVNWYKDSSKFNDSIYIYYSDYFPKDASIDNPTIILKILNLKQNKIQIIDTLAVKNVEDDLFYFNPYFIRDENNGKLTYMVLRNYVQGNNPKLCAIVYEWNFYNEKKSLLYVVKIDRDLEIDNSVHRIFKNHLYISTDHEIIMFNKRNRPKIIYKSSNFKILDFYLE